MLKTALITFTALVIGIISGCLLLIYTNAPQDIAVFAGCVVGLLTAAMLMCGEMEVED